MKFNRFWLGLVLVLTLSGQTLYAQQSDTDAKKLAEIRAKAEKGDAKAQWELGKAFSNGEFGLEKDQQEAFKWIRKAAEQNDAMAQGSLGFLYLYGLGVAPNTAEALKWYRKAAEQNESIAQSNLAWCYYYGIGVTKDTTEALKWYRKAAEQNFALAQRSVGEGYFKGIGVEKNMMEAYKWFLLAAAQGDEDAKSRVRHLEKKLKKDQIAEVKKQVAEWTQQHKKATN
ncbi:MAG: tetratricopeptide repeat protein [Candidatus Omnitrophica bacterium]|nr:tetratricopeptide repeat protein [Candidatus Omnitrophota bacterium]MDD5430538.1 tetratricopeptide repeat protein [Candidatus Omnitrophota bacterium]